MARKPTQKLLGFGRLVFRVKGEHAIFQMHLANWPVQSNQHPFILWIGGCLVMTSVVHVLGVPWQQEESN